jgi:uncharacterized protein
MNSWEMAGLRVLPGTRASGYMEVAKTADGNAVHLPVIVVRGAHDGPVLSIDGGTHGDEVEGVESVIRLTSAVDPLKLRGTIVAVPVVNMMSFVTRERSALIDRYAHGDINRNYPGRAAGSITERVANRYLNDIVARADYLLTCHSGGNYYFVTPKITFEETGDADLDRRTFDLARSFGIDILWKNLPHDGMLASAAVGLGIPAAVPEIGGTQRAPISSIDAVQLGVDGFFNTLRHLEMIEGAPTIPERYWVIEGESHVYCNNGGLMQYDPAIKPKAVISKGDRLGVILDPLGQVIEEPIALWDGLVTTMRTMPVLNPGDWFIGIGRVVAEH